MVYGFEFWLLSNKEAAFRASSMHCYRHWRNSNEPQSLKPTVSFLSVSFRITRGESEDFELQSTTGVPGVLRFSTTFSWPSSASHYQIWLVFWFSLFALIKMPFSVCHFLCAISVCVVPNTRREVFAECQLRVTLRWPGGSTINWKFQFGTCSNVHCNVRCEIASIFWLHTGIDRATVVR